MFQKSKISHQVEAYCTDGVNEATYTFIEDYDEYWGDIVKQKFFEEFGVYPTSMKRVSYTAI